MMAAVEYKNFIIWLYSHYVPVDSENKLLSYCAITVYILSSNYSLYLSTYQTHRGLLAMNWIIIYSGDGLYHLFDVNP